MHPPQHAHPSAPAFITWVEHLLATSEPGTRLPPHTQMARTWKLAPATVRVLLRPYQEKGGIVSVPGRGTCVGPLPVPDPDSAPSPAAASSVQSVADALGRMLSTGELRRGDALPPVKLVCTQHRVTPATVSRAYRQLAAQGRVVRVGKRYWVGGLDTSALAHANRFVHVFHHGRATAEEFLSALHYAPAIAEFEAELQQLHIRLVFEPAAQMSNRLARWRAAHEGPVGIVVASEDSEFLEDAGRELERFLSSRLLHRPRALLAGVRTQRRSRSLLHFTHGHIPTIKARTVVQAAEEHRHVQLDVILHNPRPKASAVRDAFRLLGERDAGGMSMPVRYVVTRNEHVDTPDSLVRLLRASWADDYLLSITARHGEKGLCSLAERVEVVDSLEEWYARSRPGSLWYFLDDRRAVEALRWCRDNARPVPSHAAILCEHDSPLCHQHGVSACVTDWRTIGYLLAHALVGDIPVARTTKGYIRTNVRIFDRLTTP